MTKGHFHFLQPFSLLRFELSSVLIDLQGLLIVHFFLLPLLKLPSLFFFDLLLVPLIRLNLLHLFSLAPGPQVPKPQVRKPPF